MTAVLLFLAGAGAAVVAASAMRPVLQAPLLRRENYRGASLPTASGICLIAAVLGIEGVRSVVDPSTTSARVLVLGAVVGFGLLGALDDLLGDAGDRGLRGHVQAALRGRVTTGFLKLAGGAALGVALAGGAGAGSVARVLVDGALVALAANLGNLFDRAPARTIKWALVAYVPLAVVVGAGPAGTALAPVMGAAAGMLPGDARERHMLGDAGANPIGAALGITAVLALGPTARTAVAAVLLVLNLLSEVVSFSRVIGAVPPLRAFDRLGRLAVAAAVVLVAVVGVAPQADAQSSDDRRLLIVSLPGLTWSELRDADLPAIEGLLADGAVADLAPRSVRHSSRAGDAYLTVGAGTRAVGAVDVDGQVVPTDADFAGEPASGVFERRTDATADGAAVALPWPTFERANAREPYDAVLGLLASTLVSHDVAVAAIANADGSDESAVSYERQAALAMVDREGRLPAGEVGAELLEDDATAPFGVRLDPAQVLDAFDAAWSGAGRRMVLVEASDLARSLRYRSLVDADRYAELRRRALTDADDLVGRLLEDVDPTRDAVLVVAPYFAASKSPLTVVGLRGPGVPVGYLQSASSQRAGIVTLVDVAPSVLDAFDIARPTEMEGRPFEVERSSTSFDHRVDRLVDLNAASRFREQLLTPTTIAVVLVLAALIAAMVVAMVDDRSRRWRSAISFLALVDVSALPMSYLARAFPLEDLGVGFYWSFLAMGALALATAAWATGRRAGGGALASLAVVLGVSIVVLVGDVMTGSNLHLSAAFGYSPTGNSRLYGISNYSFGLLSAATCLMAAMVARRWPSERGRRLAVGLMVAVLVVLGVPIWGSDVGGIIAFTPTILVFGSLLSGRRPSMRFLAAAGLAAVAAVLAFGFVDLARPEAERAHLGRLFERVGDEGLQPLISIVERKLLANLRVSTSSFWVAAVPLALGTWLFLRSWTTRPLAALHRRVPTLHAALVAGVVAAVLGSLVNDSGAIVGGVACLVLAATLVHLVMAESDP